MSVNTKRKKSNKNSREKRGKQARKIHNHVFFFSLGLFVVIIFSVFSLYHASYPNVLGISVMNTTIPIKNFQLVKRAAPTPTPCITHSTGSGIIPMPAHISYGTTDFPISNQTIIYYSSSDDTKIAHYLANKIFLFTCGEVNVQVQRITDASYSFVKNNPKILNGNIFLSLVNASSNQKDYQIAEGYQLVVNHATIFLQANQSEGIFRGIQSIEQLLTYKGNQWVVPSVNIQDYPRFMWRGAMLDVARHFFSVADVEHYIDQLAYYKMNIFHLHLTDDQGWRIQIQSHPELTNNENGFYTQNDYKNIVAYAQQRYITVVPEIDMPGHSGVVCRTHPEISCGGGVTILPSTAAVTLEKDVMSQIAAITPGNYIHIGGDEPYNGGDAVTPNEYNQFISKLPTIVPSNKIMIGWNEIGDATIGRSMIVQMWNSLSQTKNAVNQGAKVIMSPCWNAYLDMQYGQAIPSSFGVHWCRYISVQRAYQWDPTAQGIDANNVLGVEAPLWTETISTVPQMQYMIFPRIIDIAEVGWSPTQSSWSNYSQRLGQQASWLKSNKINYYADPQIPWQ